MTETMELRYGYETNRTLRKTNQDVTERKETEEQRGNQNFSATL